MSLNRYHNSRNSDNVFKLLHEEDSYLDILKGNVKSVYKDEIEEDKAVGPDEQQLLHEQDPGLDAIDDSKVDKKPEDEGTPEQQADAAEEAGKEVKEDVDALIERELKEISIAVARQSAARVASKKGLAAKGLLRGKESLKKVPHMKKKIRIGRV